jgi:hypothetical protein
MLLMILKIIKKIIILFKYKLIYIIMNMINNENMSNSSYKTLINSDKIVIRFLQIYMKEHQYIYNGSNNIINDCKKLFVKTLKNGKLECENIMPSIYHEYNVKRKNRSIYDFNNDSIDNELFFSLQFVKEDEQLDNRFNFILNSLIC